MSVNAEGLRQLAALNLSGEALAVVLKVVAESLEDQRSVGARRQARYRERQRNESVTVERNESVTVVTPTVTNVTPTRVEPILTKVEDKEKKESKRGTRLPSDFVPSEAVWNLGVELLGEAKAKLQLESFRDHWAHKPGAGGVGLDWHAAFRKWLRKAAEWSQPARAGPSAISHINGHSDPEKSIHAALRRIRENLSEPSDDGPIQSLLSNQSR